MGSVYLGVFANKQITWYQLISLLSKVKDEVERVSYISVCTFLRQKPCHHSLGDRA